MFTGIIEDLAEVVSVKKDGKNLHIELYSSFTSDLKIDQSVAHNGVCLTVVDIKSDIYTVTAIKETLQKSNIGYLKKGSKNQSLQLYQHIQQFGQHALGPYGHLLYPPSSYFSQYLPYCPFLDSLYYFFVRFLLSL